jgi:hypothetical protein
LLQRFSIGRRSRSRSSLHLHEGLDRGPDTAGEGGARYVLVDCVHCVVAVGIEQAPWLGSALARLETVAVGAFDGARELHSGRDVDLAKDVAQVSLHRLFAEEELGGDLGIRLPVDD